MSNEQKYKYLNTIAPEELKLAARGVYREWAGEGGELPRFKIKAGLTKKEA